MSTGNSDKRFVLQIPQGRSPLPLHYQVRQRLMDAIAEGAVGPGDALPTELELARQAGVSRSTIRQALGVLEQDGLIERRAGRGTRVVEPPLQQELSHLTGFAEDMLALGLQPGARTLNSETLPATARVAEQLQLKAETPVVRIERIRLGDGQPILFDISYLKPDVGDRLAAEDLTARPIFSLLEEDYGILLDEADYRIQAVAAAPYIAQALGLAAGDPLLMIERTTYTVDGAPVDYENLYYRGDRMAYSLRLRRKGRWWR